MVNKKIVCLGGGVGTVNLLRGLKKYFSNISVVVSMADEGGSSGRLRRLYDIHPPGDLISCMAALSKNENLSKFLIYRFPGDRYAKDSLLDGHKLGNLMMVGAINATGDFNKAIHFLQKIFNIPGNFLPATFERIKISAKTIEGREIFGEENIDLGKYKGKRVLERIFLHPQKPKAFSETIRRLKEADVIIGGPGDLYTNLLPILIIPDISKIVKSSKAQKIFVVNVANKPFETRGYDVSDYIAAIKRHIGFFPFKKIIVNNDFSINIPRKFHYNYVKFKKKNSVNGVLVFEKKLIDKNFPLYHDSSKLAKAILSCV